MDEIQGFIIRGETHDDHDEISLVNDLAFNGKNEGELVRCLRKRTEFISRLSLVAEYEGAIIGHILFYPLYIVSEKERIQTLSLGPMSVRPGFQNKGLGSCMITSGLKIAEEMGFNSVVVLGHPRYYPKFGFRKASKWKIVPNFDAPDEAMMALEIRKESLNFGGGTIDYPPEFFDTI
jgi:putative acetyltransferase